MNCVMLYDNKALREGGISMVTLFCDGEMCHIIFYLDELTHFLEGYYYYALAFGCKLTVCL